MTRYFLLGLFGFLMVSCNKEYEVSSKLYVGTQRSIDKTIPFPYFIQENDDRLNFLNYKGELIDSCAYNQTMKVGDTLAFSNYPFQLLHVSKDHINGFVINDQTRFPFNEGIPIWKNRAKLVKALVTKGNFLDKIPSLVHGKTFYAPAIAGNPNSDLDIQKFWTFGTDSLTTTRVYLYAGREVYREYVQKPLTFTDIEGQLFFSENDNVEDNPQLIFQILDIGRKGLKVRYFDENKEKIEFLKSSDEESIAGTAVNFNRCFDGYQGEYYYSSSYSKGDITYLFGNDSLINRVNKNLNITDTNEGYVTIHFTINCTGDIGHFGLELMDFKYQSTSFSKELIAHLIYEVAQLKEWPRIQPHWMEFKDVHGFLMFKIENGKISDLCP